MKNKQQKSNKSPENAENIKTKKVAESGLSEAERDKKMDQILSENTRILEFISSTSDSLKTLQADVSEIKSTQTNDAKKMRKITKQVEDLHSQVAALSAENNALQQNSLSRDIVIFGLPALPQNATKCQNSSLLSLQQQQHL